MRTNILIYVYIRNEKPVTSKSFIENEIKKNQLQDSLELIRNEWMKKKKTTIVNIQPMPKYYVLVKIPVLSVLYIVCDKSKQMNVY